MVATPDTVNHSIFTQILAADAGTGERQPATFSNIAEIDYDEPRRVLEVLFKPGSIYQYFDVPPLEYQALYRANSHGQYLNANI
jgi:hypothetical protein